MPDPNAHADTLKVPDEYTPPTIKDALPPMWWFCPWPVVTALVETVDHLKSTSRGEQAARIAAERKADEEAAKLLVKCDDYARALAEARNDRNDLLLAMEREVKRIEGYPALDNSIDLVKWAVDYGMYWKTETEKARRQRDEADNQLDAARRISTEYRRQLDECQGRFEQEQLDHAATLGYVRKVEAQLKRLKAKGKLLFEDKVGGNSIYAPKPKAKKKGGRK